MCDPSSARPYAITNWSPWSPWDTSLYRAGDRWFAASTYEGAVECGSIQATVLWTSQDTVTWDPVPLGEVFGFGYQGSCITHQYRGDPFYLEPDTISAVVAAGDEYVFLGTGAWVWTPGAAP